MKPRWNPMQDNKRKPLKGRAELFCCIPQWLRNDKFYCSVIILLNLQFQITKFLINLSPCILLFIIIKLQINSNLSNTVCEEDMISFNQYLHIFCYKYYAYWQFYDSCLNKIYVREKDFNSPLRVGKQIFN